ncbi:carbohydrate binding domain-containing protein [Bacteroides sp.]|uniref:carbohydrate binding domain-containing protein n=1 Tax=Bacteroides sp. TaxID=29523 RepID=UPI002FC6ABE3
MRKIHKLLFLVTIACMSTAIQLKAQKTENMNIFPNGGFEKWENERPVNWFVNEQLFPERVNESRPGGNGNYALKVHLNDSYFELSKPIPIKAGTKYVLSFWYKGNIDYNRIRVTLLWYTDESITQRMYDVLVVKTEEGEWKQAKVITTAPNNVNKIKMQVRMKSAYMGNVVFDDFAMVPEDSSNESGSAPGLEAPKNLKSKAYQGEMEISWDKAANNEVKWEVTFDDKVETTTSKNSFIKTSLFPGSEHIIKVRAVKENIFSPYTEQTVRTKAMKHTKESEDRVPYLRSIAPGGYIEGRFLKLYYNELATPNAQIYYKLNGITIEPKDNTLEFPDFEGPHQQFHLEIYIKEEEGYEWEILYPQLSVRKK